MPVVDKQLFILYTIYPDARCVEQSVLLIGIDLQIKISIQVKTKNSGYTTLQIEAISAFARRTEIDVADQSILADAFPKMKPKRAARVAAAYGRGQMQECGSELRSMVRAWLVLGEVEFEHICVAAQVVKLAAKSAFAVFADFLQACRQVFSQIGFSELVEKLRPLWLCPKFRHDLFVASMAIA
ncbi:MAG: hypothetical protein V4467_01735 [Patescibacteria group bacterium]